MPSILADWTAREGRVVVRPSREFGQFVRSDFFAEYDPTPNDLPGEVALIPFIANVAPIAWLSGREWTVPVIDAEFESSLEAIRAVFADRYPDVDWSGRLRSEVAREPPPGGGIGHSPPTAMLFSGGVDSTYTSLANRHEPQLLVSVWGSDFALGNQRGWGTVRTNLEAHAVRWGHRSAFVRSNFRWFLDIPRIEGLWPELGSWWRQVQHGIGLLGLAAPTVPRVEGARLMIAATFTASQRKVWASLPDTDELFRWGGVIVEHHGFEVGRQEKLARIAAWTHDTGPPTLRVCFSNPYGDGENCMRCEKCLRTAAVLIVMGESHREYGFAGSARSITRRIRRRFATHRIPTPVDDSGFWMMWAQVRDAGSLSRHRPEGTSDPAVRGFLRWLESFDFDGYMLRHQRLSRLGERMLRLVRRVPLVESILRRARAAWLWIGRRIRSG